MAETGEMPPPMPEQLDMFTDYAALDARRQMGGFYYLEEVKDVPGIGEKRFEALKESFFCEPIPAQSSGM